MAIIGILAALLFPALARAKGYAKTVGCKNHLLQMGIALQIYMHDNRSEYPFYPGPAGPSYGDAVGKGGRAVGLAYWSTKLFPYYPLNWTNTALQCPGYTGKVSGPYLAGIIDRQGSYGYNLEGARIDDRINEWLGLGPVMYWKNSPKTYVSPTSESQIRVPSDMLAMGDSSMVVGPLTGNVRLGAAEDGGDDAWGCSLNAWLLIYAARHGKNYNVVFCDGHVSAMNPSFLFNPSKTASMWNYDHQPHPELWTQ